MRDRARHCDVHIASDRGRNRWCLAQNVSSVRLELEVPSAWAGTLLDSGRPTASFQSEVYYLHHLTDKIITHRNP